ncbi:MAG: hypothetical protein U1E89_18835 [Burkholderiaceae bacterium]
MTAIAHALARAHRLGALAGAAACSLALAQPQATAPSEAERLVFMDPHLAGITPPRTLRYAYAEQGGADGPRSERMTLELRADAGGACCDVRGRFLAPPRALQLPEIAAARSNPALLYFLEHEVRQLQQQTRGQSAHFRQRIRLALANDARVAATTVRWQGREVPARGVQIAPFVDDPYRQRFEALAKKEYTFVLSTSVPGGLYQVRTSLPGTPQRETLTLEEDIDAAAPRR